MTYETRLCAHTFKSARETITSRHKRRAHQQPPPSSRLTHRIPCPNSTRAKSPCCPTPPKLTSNMSLWHACTISSAHSLPSTITTFIAQAKPQDANASLRCRRMVHRRDTLHQQRVIALGTQMLETTSRSPPRRIRHSAIVRTLICTPANICIHACMHKSSNPHPSMPTQQSRFHKPQP